ncbi:DEAD/DEAH box helicase [Subtercola lobariae]|uniref:DNA helicase n=1 Tax=Subtercola lobariae TaxID=1588641 RepID=A0A917ETI7_9MICO|nr:DEAD/DEAH box helicase [Subtercola lobariae]GGF13674.1 DNA helicase [Subtercola lobariae]
MPSDAFPLVDVADIVRLVGPPAFERGRGYARGSEIVDVLWNPENGMLEGVVQGSAALPYHCRISLTEAGSKFLIEHESACSCPVAFDCKHVAATLLASNARHLRETAAASGLTPARELGSRARFDSRYEPQTRGERDSGSAAMTKWHVDDQAADLVRAADETWYPPEPRHRPAPAFDPSDWRAALTGNRSRVEPPAPTPMGLQFEIREFVTRTKEQWRGLQSQTAKPGRPGDDAGRPPRRLAVRPVIRNHAGTFVKANVSWATFAHHVNRLNLDERQLRWFAQFQALHRATRELYSANEADWLYLDDFASPLMWNLLGEAGSLGIPLLGSKKSVAVHVEAHASVRLDAAGGAADDLVLTPVVTIDGHDFAADTAGAIGDHGVYFYELGEGARIVLAPLGAESADTFAAGAGAVPVAQRSALGSTAPRLTPDVRELLGRASVITVPAADRTEFFENYFGRLRREVTVTPVDDSVQLPAVVTPTLLLTARFRPKNVLQLDWSWRYGDVAAAAWNERDPAAEETISESVTRLLERLIDDHSGQGIEGAMLGFDDTSQRDARGSQFGALSPNLVLQGFEAAVFAEKVLPALEGQVDVRVQIVGTRPPYRELTGSPELTITTVESDKRDWFDLGIVVNMNGYRIPFAPLFKALARKQKKLLMVDKTYLTLDHPVFDRLRELLEEASALDEWQTGVRISRYQADLWSEFEDLAEETVQAVAWREAVSALNDTELIAPTPLPTGLAASLRPYQLAGFEWLAFLHQHGLGGVLADDMGLGKTLQTLALFAHARQSGARDAPPFLVVAPTSVVSNWASEAARFTPGLSVKAIAATQAKSPTSLADAARGADIVVTSYTLFRLDEQHYRNLGWSGLVLDEAQFVKNHTSKLHRCAKEFDAPFKLAITGTPLENNLMELWSLFDIVAPGLFASARKFTEDYVRPIERGLDTELLGRLRRRIRPFLMRRTKELVAPELPAKQEQVLNIALTPAHRTLYDTFFQRERQKLLGLIDDLDRNRLIVFRSLTLLRMLSLDASLIDEKYAGLGSAKLDALLEQIEDVAAEGHRALVFSQFTSFLGKAAERLTERGVEFDYLDGSTRRRADVIAHFKAGTAPVFLISLKAGGFGLNLTEADYVFLLDPWWNPATESQAIDRTHRIGQQKSVNVYRLVASDTIEEKVMALKAKKAQLFDAVLDDDAAFSTALSTDDIRGLLDA